jgi:peptidyl-prolyl cis-trans isomerase NIMA-interacting 1
MIQGFIAEINSGQRSFVDIAEKESHCSSHQNGGDLGYFTRGQMQVRCH